MKQETLQVLINISPLFVLAVWIVFTLYWLIGRESFAQNRIDRAINEEVLKGNKNAIMMKKHSFRYGQWKDEKLIMEALKGNDFALDALRIEERRK